MTQIIQVCGALASTITLQWGHPYRIYSHQKERILRINNLKIQKQIGDILRGKIVHVKQNMLAEVLRLVVLDSSNRHQTIKISDSSVCYNAYALLRSINMWYKTNILKIHPKGMAYFWKNEFCKNVQNMNIILLQHLKTDF